MKGKGIKETKQRNKNKLNKKRDEKKHVLTPLISKSFRCKVSNPFINVFVILDPILL